MKLIKPEQVKVVTATKEGECDIHITLDINLTIDSDGLKLNLKTLNEATKEEEEVNWAIPDFSTKNKFKFGKEEK